MKIKNFISLSMLAAALSANQVNSADAVKLTGTNNSPKLEYSVEKIEQQPYYQVKALYDITNIINTARQNNLDLSVQYTNHSSAAHLQFDLILKTRTVYILAKRIIESRRWAVEDYEREAKDITYASLNFLEEARQALGNHPFHHVIIGREKYIVQAANKKRVRIPDQFVDYIKADIPAWQDPNINYSTIKDLAGRAEKHIPPEFRPKIK